MKIALVFDRAPDSGGAFHQSINTIKWFKRSCGELFDVEIYHLEPGGANYLKEIGIKSIPLHPTRKSSIIEAAIRSSAHLMTRHRLNLISPREKQLISAGVKLVYFPSPSPFALCLQTLKYFLTIYDVCHRDFPEFPESGFDAREAYNTRAMIKALLVIADSKELKLKLQRMYGLADERTLVVPFMPSEYVRSERSTDNEFFLRKYGLNRGYLFYPAQIWSHKNHVRIIQSLQILKQKGRIVHAAFAGSDKGGQAHASKTAVALGVLDQIHFLGFVPSEDLIGLYKNSLALIMPTYFGPTNLPPLEAWALDVPVIYSKHLTAGIEGAVLSVDPDIPESLAEAIEKVMQEEIAQKLRVGGRRCLAHAESQLLSSEGILRDHLRRFEQRRETWE